MFSRRQRIPVQPSHHEKQRKGSPLPCQLTQRNNLQPETVKLTAGEDALFHVLSGKDANDILSFEGNAGDDNDGNVSVTSSVGGSCRSNGSVGLDDDNGPGDC